MIKYYVQKRYPNGTIMKYIDGVLFMWKTKYNRWVKINTHWVELYKDTLIELDVHNYPLMPDGIKKEMFYDEVLD